MEYYQRPDDTSTRNTANVFGHNQQQQTTAYQQRAMPYNSDGEYQSIDQPEVNLRMNQVEVSRDPNYIDMQSFEDETGPTGKIENYNQLRMKQTPFSQKYQEHYQQAYDRNYQSIPFFPGSNPNYLDRQFMVQANRHQMNQNRQMFNVDRVNRHMGMPTPSVFPERQVNPPIQNYSYYPPNQYVTASQGIMNPNDPLYSQQQLGRTNQYSSRSPHRYNAYPQQYQQPALMQQQMIAPGAMNPMQNQNIEMMRNNQNMRNNRSTSPISQQSGTHTQQRFQISQNQTQTQFMPYSSQQPVKPRYNMQNMEEQYTTQQQQIVYSSLNEQLEGATSQEQTKDWINNNNSDAKENVVFSLFGREYQIYGDQIITDEEANSIYEKLLIDIQNSGVNFQKINNTSSWKEDETQLLQWSVFCYAVQKNKLIEEFDEADWTNIAEFIPTRDSFKCVKRWLFLQKLGGNKLQWSAREDQVLRALVESVGAKEWSKIAEQFNQEIGGNSNRNGKQCRERWMNTLNPTIKKGKWSSQEDLILVEKQRELGNKWSEISIYLQGRTENQIKNRFNSLIKKEKVTQAQNHGQKMNTSQLVNEIINRLKSLTKRTISQRKQVTNMRIENKNNNLRHEGYSTVHEEQESDGGYADDSESVEQELEDAESMIEYDSNPQNHEMMSDINLEQHYDLQKTRTNFNLSNDDDGRSKFSPYSEEIKEKEHIKDFQKLHEESFKGMLKQKPKKQKEMKQATKTKDLLMDFVRIDSIGKIKRNLSNVSKESSFGRHSHSGGKLKRQSSNNQHKYEDQTMNEEGAGQRDANDKVESNEMIEVESALIQDPRISVTKFADSKLDQ